tara:strand:- start:770 stop:1078 length:309 start_codon:yes stop_codon:yes gene_type:complete
MIVERVRGEISDLDKLLEAKATAIFSLSHVLTPAIRTDFPQVHIAAKRILESVHNIPQQRRFIGSEFVKPRKSRLHAAAPKKGIPFRYRKCLTEAIWSLQKA